MKLSKILFDGATRGLDKLATGFSHASAMFEMLGIGASVPTEEEARREAEEDAAAAVLSHVAAVLVARSVTPEKIRMAQKTVYGVDVGKDYVTVAKMTNGRLMSVRSFALGENPWRTFTPEEKLAKRMELRAQLGRKGPPPPHRAPGDWQWRVHMERQALAKDRAELESLRTSAQRLGRVWDLRHRIMKHEHTLAQLRGQHLRPKKPCKTCEANAAHVARSIERLDKLAQAQSPAPPLPLADICASARASTRAAVAHTNRVLGRTAPSPPKNGWIDADHGWRREVYGLTRSFYRDDVKVGYISGGNNHQEVWKAVRLYPDHARPHPHYAARDFKQRHAAQRWVEEHV